MLLEAGRDGKDVRIEDDVGRIEPGVVDEQRVRALADLDLALDRVRLSLFVERHHDDARAEAADDRRLLQEFFFAFLEADRVDDRLALHALEAGEDHRPFRAVDDDGDARDFGLGRDVVEELGDRMLGVEHPLVHVHVDQVGAAAHLIERDAGGVGVVAAADQPREPRRSRHVGPLADHLKVRVGPDGEHFKTGKPGRIRDLGLRIRSRFGIRSWRQTFHGF